MDNTKAKLKYNASRRPMGIYLIRNLVNGKVFIGSTANLDAVFNSIRFKLYAGSHSSKSLEADWKEYGTGKFAFEVLEELSPREAPNYDVAAELETLEGRWLEKLKPYGEKGYNEPNKSRDEASRLIAAKRES